LGHDDAPTTQVPIVRDDNPPTTKVPIVRDDNPPTTKVPIVRDDDAPTTIIKAVADARPTKNAPFVRVAAPRPPQPVDAEQPADDGDKVTPTVVDSDALPPVPADDEPSSPATADDSAASAKPAKPAKPKGRKALVAVLIVVLALLLAGAGTLIALTKQYEGKAKIGTQVAGVNVAGQTADALAATAQSVGGNFNITTSLDGQQKTFSMADLGVTLDAQKTAQQALAADSGRFGWVPFHSTDVPLAYSYSASQIQQVLTKAYVADDKLPQDATVTFDDGSGAYVATPDSNGLNVDPAPVTAAIDTIAKGGAAGTVTLTTVDTAATVQAAAANTAAAAANALLKQSYTFTAGSKSVTLTPDQLSQFITLTANPATAGIDVGVDQSGVAAGLPGILNAALAQPPVNEQDLYTPDGSKKIAVGTWGQDGTVVADADASAAAQALVAAMNGGQPVTFGVTTTPQKYSIDKVNVGGAYDQPNGSKWIDVNQTTFKVTLYEGTTQVFQTTGVTGAPITPTDNGTFYIYLRYTTQTMRGYNADGTRYVSPNVPWVSYFNASQALHGAPWRSTFGYKASHGCVNLPVPDAKYIFDWAPLGTKVVVHD